jgi:hypothetical protein
LFLAELILCALFRRLVRSPAKQFRTVAEPFSGQVIETAFDDELGLKRQPGFFFVFLSLDSNDWDRWERFQ